MAKKIVLLAIELEDCNLPADALVGVLAQTLGDNTGAEAVSGAVITHDVWEHMGAALWVGLGNEDDLGDKALEATCAVFPAAGSRPNGRCVRHRAYDSDYCPLCGTARVIG